MIVKEFCIFLDINVLDIPFLSKMCENSEEVVAVKHGLTINGI